MRSELYEVATAPVEWTGCVIGGIVRSELYEVATAPVEWTGGIIGGLVAGRFIPQTDLVLDGILYDISTGLRVPSHHVVFANRFDNVFDWGAAKAGPNGGYIVIIRDAAAAFDIDNYMEWFYNPVEAPPGKYYFVQQVVQRGPTTYDLYGRKVCPGGISTGEDIIVNDPGFPIGSVKVNCFEVGLDVENFHITRGVNEIGTTDLTLWNLDQNTPFGNLHDPQYLDDVFIRMGRAEDGAGAMKVRFEGVVENVQPSSQGARSQVVIQAAHYDRFLAKNYVKCWNTRYRDRSIRQILQGTIGVTTDGAGFLPGVDSLLYGLKIQVRCADVLLDLPLHVNLDGLFEIGNRIAEDAITAANIPFFTISDGMTYYQALELLADLVGYRFTIVIKRNASTDAPEEAHLLFQPRVTEADTPVRAFAHGTIQSNNVRRDNTQRVDMVKVLGSRDTGVVGQFPLESQDTSPTPFDPFAVRKEFTAELPNLLDQQLADDLARLEYERRSREQLEGAFHYDGTDGYDVQPGNLVEFTDAVNGFDAEKAEANRVVDSYTHDTLGAPKYTISVEPDKGIYLQQQSIAQIATRIQVMQAFTPFVKFVTEVPRGPIDSRNTAFQLSSDATEDFPVTVFLNGLRLAPDDVQVRDDIIYLSTPPAARDTEDPESRDDTIIVMYLAKDPATICVHRVSESIEVEESVVPSLEAPGTPL